MLSTEALGIRFGGHQAVDAVSAQFSAGTLTAIVGPNGAGKTTYFNLISGQLRATSGRVLLEGRDISGLGPSERSLLGLGRAFQLTNLFPHLSVQENVRIALQARSSLGLNWWSVWSSHKALLLRAEQILEQVGLAARRDQTAASLAHGDQRKLEVAVLLALDPKVYMFDEPTAGMSGDDVPVILALIQQIKRQRDRVVLLVEHKMDVVSELADRIMVLHNGAMVADGDPATVMALPVVQEAYLGIAVQEMP
jgi:branched-chain amino acid transport system ATP-binding protein